MSPRACQEAKKEEIRVFVAGHSACLESRCLVQKEVENLITWIKDAGTTKEKQIKTDFLLFLHPEELNFHWDNRK